MVRLDQGQRTAKRSVWRGMAQRRLGAILAALLAVFAVVILAGFQLFKPQIADRVFDWAVDSRVGIDPTADFEDGLHIYLCGTGSPMPDRTRAGPCLGVVAGERAYIFDVGAGGVRNLSAMGFPMARLQAVYLTHLHSDHIDGLGELLLMAWIGGTRAAPLPVIGPIGTSQIVAGFNAAYRLDSGYRIAHHGPEVAPPSGYGGQAAEFSVGLGPMASKVVFADDHLKITAIGVAHSPVEPAVGYRIDYKDRSVSLSGDTVPHPGFIAASKGVDVMFHEALNPDMVRKIGGKLAERGQRHTARIMEDILDYHTPPEAAARAAQDAGAGALYLYHLVPPMPIGLIEVAFLGDAASYFDGPIVIGADGMLISLPIGSEKLTVQQRF